MESIDGAQRGLFESVGLAESAGLLVGSLYVTGYYITSIFVRNYGVPESELFRLEYIKIGLVFWLLAGGLVLIPFGAFYLTYKVRHSSGLPHFMLGWVGNSLNTTVMLLIPLLLAIFATRYEWYLALRKPIMGCRTLNVAVGWGLFISSFAVIFLPLLERVANRFTSGRSRARLFRFAIEPSRYLCLFVSLYLIVRAVWQIPWLTTVLGRSVSFFAVSVLFVGAIIAAVAWIRQIRSVRGSTMVLVLIAFGISFFYYLVVTSYVFGVYPAIPANRGGRMPITEAFMQVSDRETVVGAHRTIGELALTGPVYILEDHGDMIYFASERMDHWFDEFIPVHALSRDRVPYIRFERISDGFPRVARKSQELNPSRP